MRLQVIQQTAAFADQLQQATPGCVILLVGLEMLGQFANPLTQNRNLDLRRTGVRIVGAEAFNQVVFFAVASTACVTPLVFSDPLLSV